METIANPRVTLKAKYLEHNFYPRQSDESQLYPFVVVKCLCKEGKEIYFKGVLEEAEERNTMINLVHGELLELTLEIEARKFYRMQEMDYAVNYRIEWVNALKLVGVKKLSSPSPAPATSSPHFRPKPKKK